MEPLTVYFDYTCRYSYRALGWLDRAAPGIPVRWATFSLKEVNRGPEEPSYLEPGAPASLAVLAQGLAHAAREADFDRYHRAVFTAMHAEERRLDEQEFLALAADAGVDVAAFGADRGRWVGEVGREHREAASRWGVFGTPTLVLAGAAAFVRLAEEPASDAEAAGLLDALRTIAAGSGVEARVFRPAPLPPQTISLGRPGGDG